MYTEIYEALEGQKKLEKRFIFSNRFERADSRRRREKPRGYEDDPDDKITREKGF